jgi:sodium transport system ATP-binding protein
MKQKVSIARTLVHDPPILIFDEPTVGLDVLNAIGLVDNVKTLRQEGKTVLYSTHIMSEVEKLCDRVAILHGGRVLACDTIEGLRASTGRHYLEDIFVHFVADEGAGARQLLAEQERRELANLKA